MRQFGLIVAGLALAGVDAHAQTFTSSAEQSVSIGGQTRELFSDDDPTLRELNYTQPGVGSARSTTLTAFGVNKTFVSVSTPADNTPTSSLSASAFAQWSDRVTIDGGSLNGTPGTFTASMTVFGSASFDRSGVYLTDKADIRGSWFTFLSSDGEFGSGGVIDSYGVGEWGFIDGELFYLGDGLNQSLAEISLDFIYGEPFTLAGALGVDLTVENSASDPGGINASLDFSHSAYWNGFSSVLDSNGKEVSGYSLSSLSGINWAQPVPEPSTLGTLALASAGLAGRRRRRRCTNSAVA